MPTICSPFYEAWTALLPDGTIGLHREGDLPAVMTSDALKQYFVNNVPARTDSGAPHSVGTRDLGPGLGVEQVSMWIKVPKEAAAAAGRFKAADQGAFKVPTLASLRPYTVFHREGDLPAVVRVVTDGLAACEIRDWMRDGVQTRDGGRPARVVSLPDGTIQQQAWYWNGVLHRDGDLPAIVDVLPGRDRRVWLRYGAIHRDGHLPAFIDGDVIRVWANYHLVHRDESDLPAITWEDGRTGWVRAGCMSRPGGGPTRVNPGGRQEWLVGTVAVVCEEGPMGLKVGCVNEYHPHRDEDLPAVVDPEGTCQWFVHGCRHREGGQPAVVFADGSRIWFVDGRRHRDGGQPAVVLADGTREWYVHGALLPAAWHASQLQPGPGPGPGPGPEFGPGPQPDLEHEYEHEYEQEQEQDQDQDHDSDQGQGSLGNLQSDSDEDADLWRQRRRHYIPQRFPHQ